MSIARAFTTRRVKQSMELRDAAQGIPHRSNTTKAGSLKPSVSIRNKISAPMELVHTTNMLSYNAPDLYPTKTASSASSSRSDDDSDMTLHTAASTPPTSPDTPFPEKRSMSPEPNHLSCYFTPPSQALANPAPANEAAPVIPQRSPSHTKKHSESLARQRSISRMSEQSSRSHSTKASFSFSRSSSSSTTTSATSISHPSTPHYHSLKSPTGLASPPPLMTPTTAMAPPPPVTHKKEYSESHPFGHELAQVTELAEEFGATTTTVSKERLDVIDEEEQELQSRGLRKFSANDYLNEIQAAFNTFFAEEEQHQQPVAALWI